MTLNDTSEISGSTPLAVDQIPIQVTFDLGERRLTLAELKCLQPGQVLDLGHPLSGVVNIRAHGALLGRGDLVEVDGGLGVVISELAERAV